jgi:hypothetical protein
MESSFDEKSLSSSEADHDLRSFLNSLTTHLMPELPTSFDEDRLSTEDEQSSMSEPKSTEDAIPQDSQITASLVQKSNDNAKELLTHSHDQTKTK